MNDPDFVADIKKRKSRLNPATGEEMTKIIDSVMSLPKADIAAADKVYKKLLKAK